MRSLLLALGVLLLTVEAYDVPLEKADPPLMDPRPEFPKITHRVFFKIDIDDGDDTGTVVFGLFGDIAPKAVNNFLSLARCDQGNGALSGKPLCYKNSVFHRIIPKFLIQGGDFTNNDGTGGETIYGGKLIEDESFEVRHNRPHVLSMSNKGKPNTIGSQFFINTVKTQWLDGKYVGFGIVLEGKEFVNEISKNGSNAGTPEVTVKIVDCGEMDLRPSDKEVKYW